MSVEQILGLVIQAAVVLAPMIWRLSALSSKVEGIEKRLGNGHGIPVICALHREQIEDHEERLDRLESCKSDDT